ncbi:hypothetical protein D3C72_2285160 [compost metagenome]
MLGENGFYHCSLGQAFRRLGCLFAFWFEVVDMEAKHVGVFNRVGNGVSVQLLLKQLICGLIRSLLVFHFDP